MRLPGPYPAGRRRRVSHRGLAEALDLMRCGPMRSFSICYVARGSEALGKDGLPPLTTDAVVKR